MSNTYKTRFKVVGRKNGERVCKSFTDFEECAAILLYQSLDSNSQAFYRRSKKQFKLIWGTMPNLSDLPKALMPNYEEEKKIAREYFDRNWKYDDHNEMALERGEPSRTATEWHEHWQKTDASCGFYYEDGEWRMHNWDDQEHIQIINGKVVQVEEV